MALGSYFFSSTPYILQHMDVDTIDTKQSDALEQLYGDNLVFKKYIHHIPVIACDGAKVHGL